MKCWEEYSIEYTKLFAIAKEGYKLSKNVKDFQETNDNWVCEPILFPTAISQLYTGTIQPRWKDIKDEQTNQLNFCVHQHLKTEIKSLMKHKAEKALILRGIKGTGKSSLLYLFMCQLIVKKEVG